MNIGSAIIKLRKEKKVRQYILARKIGITQTYLSQVEGNIKKNPSEKILKKICDILKISFARLYFEALEESDIAEERRELFELIKPIIQKIFTQIK